MGEKKILDCCFPSVGEVTKLEKCNSAIDQYWGGGNLWPSDMTIRTLAQEA